MAEFEGLSSQKNPINRLQEICQQWKVPMPAYCEAQGTFQEFGTEVSLTLEGETATFYGLARTKKSSKAQAAQRALDYVQETMPHFLEPPSLAVRLGYMS